MKRLSWLIAVAAITVLFFQCQKDIHYIGGPDTGGSVLPDPISASLQGNITDENDQPAVGVSVSAGTNTAITDDKGYFRFTNVTLDKNTTLVTAAKDGYFKGYRVFAATSGCNQVAIKLIKKDLAGTISAASGGEAKLSNGATVKLPAGGIVNASSGDYTGDVKVYVSYINPGSAYIGKTIPGALVGNDKNGKRTTLSSYGMLAVELTSGSGEKLQIKSGSVATLTIPIPVTSSASAPASISLWYLDETTGIRQEEGTATKQGNNYVGDVKHFSFWSADDANDGVTLSFTLQTPSGSPLVNSQVRISSVSTSDTGGSYLSAQYDFTDSLGQVKDFVPANKELTLEVLGSCGSVVYTQTIQPLTQNKDLGTLKITDNTSSLLTVAGTLQTCNNTPVSNGYAIIDFNGTRRYVSANTSGEFTTTYTTCTSSATSIFISGVDAGGQTQSSQTTITASYPLTDAGTIVACGNTVDDQYINYTIDGTNYSITASDGDSLSGFTDNSSVINISGLSSSLKQLKFYAANGRSNGVYTIGGLYVNNSADSLNINSGSEVTFTKLPTGSGDYYLGHFDNLSYLDSTFTVSHTISATFKVKQN